MKRILRFGLSVVALVVAAFLVLPFVRNWVERASPMPDDLGVTDGKLKMCPDSPNCVSTYDTDEEHGIAPIGFEGTAEEAREKLIKVLNGMDRVKIITNEVGYIHAEFRSPRMGFIDDVEFQFGEGVEGIQMRSAARLGHDDLDANRKRMEGIRRRFERLE